MSATEGLTPVQAGGLAFSSMDENVVNEISNELRRVHAVRLGDSDTYEFELMLTLIPHDSPDWKVADATPAVYVIVPDDTLFTISRTRDGRMHLTGRPLGGDRIVVGMEWGASGQSGSSQFWRETQWTFRYESQDEAELDEWQRVTGRIYYGAGGVPAELDRNEKFARSVLNRVGRRAAIVERDQLRRT